MSRDLEALRGRVMKAEGPDRDLDARIWCHFNGKAYKEAWPAHGGGTQALYTEPPKRKEFSSPPRAVTPVTASVDAALALVELKRPDDAWCIVLDAMLLAKDKKLSDALARCIVDRLLTALIDQKPETEQREG